MHPQIQAQDLRKTYIVRKSSASALKRFFRPQRQDVEALRGVSFSIGEGELVGYIGPNGAGKSTTVKILSGILRPDGGSVQALGMAPWLDRRRYVAHIGVVFGQRTQLWWDLPARDSFHLLRDIYRVPKNDFKTNMDALCDCLNLGPLLDTPVRQLSLGQRMRCEMAASLLHEPKILFLDEPTIGLDAVSKIAVRAFIKERNEQRGVTVILTTHDMDDVEALCSRVMLIGNGSILMDGSVDMLRDGEHTRILIATLQRPLPAHEIFSGMQVNQEGNKVTLTFDSRLTQSAQLIALLNEHCGIADLTIERPAIEAVIARHYRDIASGEGA